MTKGNFIVLYGTNNLGKSTQAKLLVNRFISAGLKAEYLKYPVYDIEPSGPILNEYLRKGNTMNLSTREAQIIYSLNRTQFEYMLMQKLDDGVNIIAEDYSGTGIAWGIGTGVNENFLRQINSHLLKEDISFLLDGERFKDAIEQNHKLETQNELTVKVRQIHLQLAREFGWHQIKANQGIPQIHSQIWDIIKQNIDLEKPKPTTIAEESTKPILIKEDNIKTSSDESDQNDAQPKESLITESTSTHSTSINNITVERISPLTKIPSRSHPSDAGLDLYSAQYYTLTPGERILASTGIKLIIPNGYAGLVWDKSGIAKQGVRTMAGVIDASYRGEVLVNLINLSNNIYTITPGQKIAQLLIQKIELPTITEAKVENNTDRGEKGFGSTGLNY